MRMDIIHSSVVAIEDSPRPSVDTGLFLALPITEVRLFYGNFDVRCFMTE